MPIGTALGALGALGAVGSAVGGLTAAGGQNAAAGMNLGAVQNANNAINNNATNYSPYTAGGINSQGIIGALEGYGDLVSASPGAPYAYQTDPNAFGRAQGQINALATASGAVQPTLTNYQFTPETAVSNTFQADPSYAWRLAQGIQAQKQGAAATGMSFSGAQQQALNDYAGNSASQEYANWFNRLGQQNAYNTQGNLATNAQNFGQQQQRFANTQGNWNSALSLLTGQSGLGANATQGQAGTDASLTGIGANSTNNAANNTANASQALSAGITGGVNSLASAYAYQNGMGGNGQNGSGYISPAYASNAWNNAVANSPNATTGPSSY